MIDKKKLVPGTILAIIIILILINNIDPDKFASMRLVFNWVYLGLAFFILILVNLIRSLRFNYLLDFSFKLTEIFSITAYYNFYTTIFPGGIGELSFVHLIRKNINENIPCGLSAIFLTRVYDILLMLLFCGAVLPFVSFRDLDRGKLALIIIGCTAAVILIAYYLHAIIHLLNRIFVFLAKKKSYWVIKIRDILVQTEGVLKQSKKKTGMLFLLSLVYWAVIFFIIQLLFWTMGIKLNYFESVLIGTITNLTTIIPLNTIGGFGYKEAGITLGLILLKIPKNEAILISFCFHILSILFMALLGLVGLLVKLINKKQIILK